MGTRSIPGAAGSVFPGASDLPLLPFARQGSKFARVVSERLGIGLAVDELAFPMTLDESCVHQDSKMVGNCRRRNSA